MPRVAFVTNTPERAQTCINLAPPGVEVVYVDMNLPDDQKIPLCRDADAIISMPANVSTYVLRHCPKVKLIQTLSAGFDALDVPAINEMGILIANNGGANAIAVAEQTVALMINVGQYMMQQWHNTTKNRAWRQGLTALHLTELTDKTVGIVGLGRIGRQVARRLRGFDTNTIYYDIVDIPDATRRELNARPVSFDDLLRESDIVTLHTPLNRQTRHLISHRELDMMKPSAYLINACRGPVVDEKALYEALKAGKIAGAALDVLEQEPTPKDNPLFELDNVIITPHMAGWSHETNIRAANFAYQNILRCLGGQTPESLVTPED